jgi:uncharacterized protein YggU (UPF0235/DUF167 family)
VGGSYPRSGDPAVRVRVRELAVDGQASRAALRLLAEALGGSAREVRLDVGHRSRDKLVAIVTDDPTAVAGAITHSSGKPAINGTGRA